MPEMPAPTMMTSTCSGVMLSRNSSVMADLIYSAIASLDGYVEDADGRFDWAAPGEEVHAFVNELERGIGTHLLGRRMYETMVVWETMDTGPEQEPVMRDFARIWRDADKIVYSRSLAEAPSARTRIERVFDPDAIRGLKAESERDLGIGGPDLASQAFAAGLVDECHLYLHPILVGAGKPALPDGVRLELELVDVHRFGDGVVHLRHRC